MFKNNTLRVVTQICLGKITPQKGQIVVEERGRQRKNPISFPFQSHSLTLTALLIDIGGGGGV